MAKWWVLLKDPVPEYTYYTGTGILIREAGIRMDVPQLCAFTMKMYNKIVLTFKYTFENARERKP